MTYNQQPESAVATVSKAKEEQFIPPAYQTLYLPDMDKHLQLMVDTASVRMQHCQHHSKKCTMIFTPSQRNF